MRWARSVQPVSRENPQSYPDLRRLVNRSGRWTGCRGSRAQPPRKRLEEAQLGQAVRHPELRGFQPPRPVLMTFTWRTRTGGQPWLTALLCEG